jgi:hypothetical protein
MTDSDLPPKLGNPQNEPVSGHVIPQVCWYQRLNAACARALQVGDPSYRTIKGILAAGTECDGIAEPAAPTAQAFLRGPGAFGAGETA